MKQRLLSAAVGLTLLVVVLCFYQYIVLNLAVALFAAIGVYELVKAAGLASHKGLLSISVSFGALSPFLSMPGWYDIRILAISLYIFLMFCILLRQHNRIEIGALSFCCGGTIGISFSLCCLIGIRDTAQIGAIYYILLSFVLAWVCDGGAYFVGRAFGNHKMAPIISPKKTIEGAVGGVITNLIFAALLTIVFSVWVYPEASLHMVSLLAITLLGSALGVLGDLTASAVKRQYGIKDFGKVLPGHGGVLDRFDSMLFVLPALYFVMLYMPIFGG